MIYFLLIISLVIIIPTLTKIQNQLREIKKEQELIKQLLSKANLNISAAELSQLNLLGGTNDLNTNHTTDPSDSKNNISLRKSETSETKNTEGRDTEAKFPEERKIPLFEWLKENWTIKLGVALILCAAVWSLVYAYQNQFVGPVGIATIGVAIGAALSLFGFKRMKLYSKQGSIFMFLGTSLVMLTAYYMKIWLVLTSQTLLALLMSAALAVSAAASVIYKRESLSVATFILAFFIPIIISNGQSNYPSLYTYLLLVTLSMIWIVYLTGWRKLTLLALIGVLAYSLIGFKVGFPPLDETQILLFGAMFSATFFATGTLSIIKSKDTANLGLKYDILTAILNAFLITGFIKSIISEDLHSVAITLVAIFFGTGSYFIYKLTNNVKPFFVYLGISASLLVYSTVLILKENQPALALALTCQAAIFSYLTFYLTKSAKKGERTMLAFIVPLTALMPILDQLIQYSKVSSNYAKYDTSMTLLSAFFYLATSLGLLVFYRIHKSTERSAEENSLSSFTVIGSQIFVLLVLVWGISHLILSNNAGENLALITYSIIGITFYVYGKNIESSGLKIVGTILIVAAVLKLIFALLYMDLVFRIIGFVTIGIVLLSSAFFFKKKD